jgi:hypothetical protein
VISLLRITEDAHGLVLSYPWWTTALFALFSLAVAGLFVVVRKRRTRVWPVSLAVLVAAWAGIYVATFRTAITDEAGSAYAFLRYDHAVRWKDAADIYLERNAAGDWQIVVLDRARRPYNFDVSELPVEERDRVMTYMVDRMPKSAFEPAPELLKRRSASDTRTVGLFGDQQI